MIASFAMASVAIVTDQVGAPIEFPPVDTSKAVTLTLAEGVYRGVGVEQRTRMYNGNIVGPSELSLPCLHSSPHQSSRSSGLSGLPSSWAAISM